MKHAMPVTALLIAAALAGCNAQDPARTQAMTACEAAVEKASEVLPDGLVSDVTGIEPGQSGDAVSCAVRAGGSALMIDATTTCRGDRDDLLACTAIDAVQTMDGSLLYP